MIYLFEYLLYPSPILANNDYNFYNESVNEGLIIKAWVTEGSEDVTRPTHKAEPKIVSVEQGEYMQKTLPKNQKKTIKAKEVKVITAYTSNTKECDASPCITANGFNVCRHGIEDTVAANSFPFGTKIKIPELFGERVFVVRDRMSSKYPNRIDIWMKDRGEALKFGKRVAAIEIIK